MSIPAVVTGIGLVTPLGDDEDFFDRLVSGEGGVAALDDDRWRAYGVEIAARCAADLPTTSTGLVDRFIQLALVAAERAVTDAGLKIGSDADPERTAVIVASGAGGTALFEEQVRSGAERGRSGVSPYLLPGFLPNMAAARIAIAHGVTGPSWAPASACAAGAMAVAEALRLIREGVADVVFCGGSEALAAPAVAASFHNARALARNWADPTEACRPFDARRNGFVLGEGAGLLVLEHPDHAAARGATSYGHVLGWGATTDAYHVTSPRPDGSGAAAAMRRALADAGVEPASVGYVNAHATGTKAGDVSEARAVTEVFGDHAPPVSSIKGAVGHLLGAAGAVEAATSLLALRHGVLPPTLNLDDPDPATCALDHVRGTARPANARYAVSNSFAFGGHNVSLVLGSEAAR
ncbi:MAG TPA: beta-ketoacyl-[acyl-carrier-protein] synthase family protein [Actinospica sp.]|nr:beta-ketoacyl-[acyl-carrier-protein] synthase family protein [Actinospica sp.]